MISFDHRLTAITIVDRGTPVLDRWPVRSLILMPRQPVFPKCLVDLAPGLFGEFSLSHLHFDLADRVHLGLDRREPRVDVGRSGNGHSIAPFWLYIRVAHHAEMYSSGVNPSVAARSAISRVRLLAAPFCRPPVLGRPFGLGTYLSRF